MLVRAVFDEDFDALQQRVEVFDVGLSNRSIRVNDSFVCFCQVFLVCELLAGGNLQFFFSTQMHTRVKFPARNMPTGFRKYH